MSRRMAYRTYVIAGLRNKPGRNLATIFCFAFIALNIFSGQFLTAGAAGSVDQGISRMGADLLVVPAPYLVFLRGAGQDNTVAIVTIEPSPYRMPSTVMETIGNVSGVMRMSPQLYVATLDIPYLSPVPVDIMGFDPETDLTIRPWLRNPREGGLRPGEVIVGHDITGEVLSTFTVSGHTYTLAGRLDPTQSAADHTLFMGLDDAYRLAATGGIPGSRIAPGEVNAVLVRVAPGEDPDAVAARIRRLYPPTSVAVITRHFSLDPAATEIRGLPDLLNGVAAVVVIAAFPLIALITAMVTHERQREIGLLRSMGAKQQVIILLVMAESLSLALIGGVAGVASGLAAFTFLGGSGFLTSTLQVSFSMPGPADTGLIAGMALLIVITIGGLSSLYPAYRSSRMNPYEAIRSGE
jgi:putative ABC transport system permease protein